MRMVSFRQGAARSYGRKSDAVAAYLLPVERKSHRGRDTPRKPLLDIFYHEITLVRLVKELLNVIFCKPTHS
jgi:hypothetical protein